MDKQNEPKKLADGELEHVDGGFPLIELLPPPRSTPPSKGPRDQIHVESFSWGASS